MNIEVDHRAKCLSKGEIFVNAPIEHVFKTIADINNWPKWQNHVTTAHIDGLTEQGKYFTWKANGFGIKSRLHTVQPHEEIGWTGNMWWLKAIHNWYLSSESNGTRVSVIESMQGIGASLLQKTLDQGIAINLQELKTKAEKEAEKISA